VLILPPSPTHKYDDHMYPDMLLGYEEAYNLSAMRQAIDVITFADFVRAGGVDYIAKADNYPTQNETLRGNGSSKARELAMESKRALHPIEWGAHVQQGSLDMFWFSNLAPISKRSSVQQYGYGFFYAWPKRRFARDLQGHHRRAEVLPFGDNSTVMYFPRNLLCGFSIFGIVDGADEVGETSVCDTAAALSGPRHEDSPACVRRHVEADALCRMKRGFQYVDLVKHYAGLAVLELGGTDGFSAVHMRRKDFALAYKEQVLPPTQLIERYRTVLRGWSVPALPTGSGSSAPKKEKLLIATDDEEEVREMLRANYSSELLSGDIVFFSDLVTDQTIRKLVRKSLQPLIVQYVLAEARIFGVSPFSTYSSYVIRLRGYRGVHHRTLYHTVPATIPARVGELLRNNVTVNDTALFASVASEDLLSSPTQRARMPTWAYEDELAWHHLPPVCTP